MTTLFVVRYLVGYAISVDYKAAVAVGVAMGLVPWIRKTVSIGLLSCIVDILTYTIGNAVAISSVTTSIGGYASKFTMTAMKTISFKKVYQGVVVVYL